MQKKPSGAGGLSDNDSLCLSNFESDINAVNKLGCNRKFSTIRTMGLGGITTGDEGGGITMNDESATDPEMDYKFVLNALNKP